MSDSEPVADRLVAKLSGKKHRPESASVATLSDGAIRVRRSAGKLSRLEELLAAFPLPGTTGIAHASWTTHAGARQRCPQSHATPRVAVVHTGMVEHHASIRARLAKDGIEFQGDGESELLARLTDAELSRGLGPLAAVQRALAHLDGEFAIIALFADYPGLLVAFGRGVPLVVGSRGAQRFVGSRADAFADLAREVTYLDDGDLAVLSPFGTRVHDGDGRVVERGVTRSERRLRAAPSLAPARGQPRDGVRRSPTVSGIAPARTLKGGNRGA